MNPRKKQSSALLAYPPLKRALSALGAAIVLVCIAAGSWLHAHWSAGHFHAYSSSLISQQQSRENDIKIDGLLRAHKSAITAIRDKLNSHVSQADFMSWLQSFANTCEVHVQENKEMVNDGSYHYQHYLMSANGSYSDIRRFLSGVSQNSAPLIAITHLRLEPSDSGAAVHAEIEITNYSENSQ